MKAFLSRAENALIERAGAAVRDAARAAKEQGHIIGIHTTTVQLVRSCSAAGITLLLYDWSAAAPRLEFFDRRSPSHAAREPQRLRAQVATLGGWGFRGFFNL